VMMIAFPGSDRSTYCLDLLFVFASLHLRFLAEKMRLRLKTCDWRLGSELET
jgi:hypothetical protein